MPRPIKRLAARHARRERASADRDGGAGCSLASGRARSVDGLDGRGTGGHACRPRRSPKASRRRPAGTAGRRLELACRSASGRGWSICERSSSITKSMSIGSSGVAKVELWGTRDGGRHWANFGADNDNRSPLVVSVDGEGLYGFRVVIQSGNGLSGQPPRDGDLPEVWIGVDLTKPLARITALEPGSGRRRAGDPLGGQRRAARKPAGFAVLSAISRAGRGRRSPPDWKIPAASPGGSTTACPSASILRLEARDEAGNVGRLRNARSRFARSPAAAGRIRGVRPLGQPAR